MYKRFMCRIPMDLQMFAEGAGGSGAGGSGTGAAGGEGGAAGATGGEGGQAPPAIDYEKIQKMLDGTLKAKEDTALKAYFKQQGLSEDEMKQAIEAFKQQKAQNQPDAAALQGQITEAQNREAQAQAAAQQARIESAATMMAVSLGMDAKTIPYILKMADLSKVMGQDGKINEETMKSALNQVLEDVPALKPQTKGSGGFIQVGAASGSGQPQGSDGPLTLKDAVSEALKK